MSESSVGWWRPRTFVGLVVAGLVGVLAVLPYQFALTGWPPAGVLPVVVAAALLQNGVLLAVVTLVGLRLGPVVGLRVARPAASRARTYGRAAILGVGAGVAILALDAVVFGPLVRDAVLGGPALPAGPAPGGAAGVGLLASLYGGIAEELFLRFGLMTLLAWVGWRLVGRPDELPAGVTWAAILLAAGLFGLGHLGATVAVFRLTPTVVARMLVLNGLGGVVFGWLYWRDGLVAAMVAHFGADVVLHVVTALPR